jgi:hypothetical protein
MIRRGLVFSTITVILAAAVTAAGRSFHLHSAQPDHCPRGHESAAAIYGWPTFPESGGLMSYSPDFQDMARRAAVFVDKILIGTKPADLPVEQPTRVELVINRRTAKVLDLTIPSSLLLRADRVIESWRISGEANGEAADHRGRVDLRLAFARRGCSPRALGD